MTEDRKEKQREYARKQYQKIHEGLKKQLFSRCDITPKMDREEMLKKICKEHLMGMLEWGKLVGKRLSTPQNEENAKYLEKKLKRELLLPLTRELKMAGVLPLNKKKAA